MSVRLDKFFSQSRIKVDRSLAERWVSSARTYGEHPIKTQIAQAKRTATMLMKASPQFSNVRPEQELALRAGASTMNQLALELQPLVAWAKAYKGFCDAEYKRERQEELEAIAQARWGKHEAALQFEADLAAELDTKDGQLLYGQWLHSIGEHQVVPAQNISSCMERHRVQEGRNLRERMAAAIDKERRSTDNKWGGIHGMILTSSFRTYKRYLAHRKEIASRTAGILKGFTD